MYRANLLSRVHATPPRRALHPTRGAPLLRRPHPPYHTSRRFIQLEDEEQLRQRDLVFEKEATQDRKSGGNVGMDFGTTNSCVATLEGEGKVRIIENSEGHRITPSVVAYLEDGDKMVGISAKRQRVSNPLHTITSVKRLLGRRFTEPVVEQLQSKLPYKLVADEEGLVAVEVLGKTVRAVDVAAVLFRKLRDTAEKHFSASPDAAVVGVPAYFDDAQRNAVMTAAKLGSVRIKRLINEPTAAALAYGLGQKKESVIAVYDLGGGTFDVSIMQQVDDVFEVRATAGDPHLGGDDFDDLILKKFLNDFKRKNKVDLSTDVVAMQRLRDAVENAKVELSSTIKTLVSIPFITATPEGPLHFSCDFSRSQFERITDDLFERTKAPCLRALKDSGLSVEQITDVLAVGGMSKTQRVGEIVQEVFKRAAVENALSADEAVAMGAAIYAGVSTGEASQIVLMDLTPLALGVELEGGYFSRVIERNTKLPFRTTKVYSNATGNQHYAMIRVFQGDREITAANRFLGEMMMSITPAPKNFSIIAITFDLDCDGFLRVIARDPYSGVAEDLRFRPRMLMLPEIEDEYDRNIDVDSGNYERRELYVERERAKLVIRQVDDTLAFLDHYLQPIERHKILGFKADIYDSMRALDPSEKLRAHIDTLSQYLLLLTSHYHQRRNAELGLQHQAILRPKVEEAN